MQRAGYHNLVRQNSDKALREEDIAHLIAPREEFYGSSILNFHFGDSVIVDRVLNGLREEAEDETLLFGKLFSSERRIMELDMNMMSPIAWSLQNKQFVTAQLYLDFLSHLGKTLSAEEFGKYDVIFKSVMT